MVKESFMEDRKKRNVQIGIIIGGMVFIFCCMCIISRYTSFSPDDYNYSHIPWTNQRIKNLGDILESIKSFYFNWSGRILVLFISQVILMNSPWLYAILNALVFTIFIYLIASFYSKKPSIIRVIMAAGITFLCTPVFVEDYIWISGSLNYLWPTTSMLFMTYLYFHLYGPNHVEGGGGTAYYLLLVFSFITAFFQENTTFLGGSFGVFFLIFQWKKLRKISIKYKIILIVGVVLYALGAIILILAPGNFNRASGSGSIVFDIATILSRFNTRTWRVAIIVSILIGGLMLLFYYIDSSERKKICIHFQYFYIPAVVSLVPMLFIGEFPDRALLPFLSFMFLVLVQLTESVYQKIRGKYIKMSILTIITAVLLVSFGSLSFYYATVIREYTLATEQTIERYKSAGVTDVIVEGLEVPSMLAKRYVLHDFYRPSSVKGTIPSRYMSIYYDVNSIRAVQKDDLLLTLELENEVVVPSAYSLYLYDNGVYHEEKRIGGLAESQGETTHNVVFEIAKEEMKRIRIDFPPNQLIRLKGIRVEGVDFYSYVNGTQLKDKISYRNQVDEIKLENAMLVFNAQEDTLFEITNLLE